MNDNNLFKGGINCCAGGMLNIDTNESETSVGKASH